MPKPNGAMGTESSWVPTKLESNIPQKYSNLPVSEARELIAKEQAELEEKALEAEVARRVAVEVAKLKVAVPEVKPTVESKEIAPVDLVKLADKGVLKNVDIVKFEANDVVFKIDDSEFKIVKL